jgi:hypothetical protein
MLGLEGAAAERGEVARNRVPQIGLAHGRGIVRAATADRGDAGLADMVGGIETGITARQRDDPRRRSRQLFGALRLAEPLDRLGYFDQDALPADWCRECVPTRLLALEIRRLLWRMNTATVWCYK